MIAPKPMNTNQTGGRSREETHLRGVWHVARRHRGIIAGAPLLVLLGAFTFLGTSTQVYEGATTIRIDENRSNVPVLDALRTLSSGGSQLDTEMEVLRSRTLAEEVVAELALHGELVRPRRMPRSELLADIALARTAPAGEYRLSRGSNGVFTVSSSETGRTVAQGLPGEVLRIPGGSVMLADGAADHDEITLRVRRFDEAVRRFRRTLVVSRPNREADIVMVRYEGTDPLLAERVPNTVASAFMAGRGEARGAEARSTVRFLYEQIDTLTVQLTGAEDMLRGFRERERLISPEAEATAQVKRLVELQAQRDMVRAEVAAMTALLREVESSPLATGMTPSPARRLIAFPTLLRNPAASELLRSLAEVENERATLLSRRTADDPDVVAFTERVREIEQQLGSISATYLQGLSNQVTSMNDALGGFEAELGRIPAAEIQYARLIREAKVLEEIYTLLQTRLKEAEIIAAADDPTVRVVDPAILPVRPIKPNVPLSLALAVMLGAGLGLGGAFAREHLDTTIRSRDDLQMATGGTAVLGTIPRIVDAHSHTGQRFRLPFARRNRAGAGAAAAGTAGSFQSRLVAGLDPRNPVSEAYRSLRTNITFARPGQQPRTLVFTSPAPGDGKSTSTSNLAAMLARQGVRCLLIDADMRRGVLHDVLGHPRTPGLSEVLLGRAQAADAIRTVDIGEGATFDLLPTGTLPPNPAELLGAAEMRTLLESLTEQYATILLDAPPLNVVTDAALLGTNADAVILVARAGVTDRNALHYALEQIRAVRAPLLGTVLNDVDARKDQYYGAYTSSSY
jgi:capsular exopolysaccharide synthesis family protein